MSGALCVAAASATAASWPSASAARSTASAQQAAAGLAAAATRAGTVRVGGMSSSQSADMLAFQPVRFGIGARVAAIEAAAARAATARDQALAAREHAAHVAHEEHLTVLAAVAQAAAAARAAQQAAAQQQAAARQRAAARQQAAAQQVTSSSGSPQQIAQTMLAQLGWSGQFGCLDSLWNQESGWNPSAQNPNSGAYGIPQALPGSKMASAGPDWQANPATQIRWGLDYIQSSYGSPCAAWSHEQATGWY